MLSRSCQPPPSQQELGACSLGLGAGKQSPQGLPAQVSGGGAGVGAAHDTRSIASTTTIIRINIAQVFIVQVFMKSTSFLVAA